MGGNKTPQEPQQSNSQMPSQMSINTYDGNPPMSMASGGNNTMPPMSMAQQPQIDSNMVLNHPAVQQLLSQATPDDIINHPIVQNSIAQKMAMDTAKQDEFAGISQETRDLAQKIKFLKSQGLYETDYEKRAKEHPIINGLANAAMIAGQALSGKDFTGNFYNREADLKKNQIDNITAMAKATGITPEQALMNADRKDRLDFSKDIRNKTLWANQIKSLDADRTSAQRPLGMASRAMLQTQRAYDVINNKEFPVTSQDLSLITADISSVIKGGNPTDLGMTHADYTSAYRTVQDALQFATSNPQKAMPDSLRDKLNDTVSKLRDGSKRVIVNSLKKFEAGNGRLVTDNKEDWSNYKNQVLSELGINDTQKTESTANGKSFSHLWGK